MTKRIFSIFSLILITVFIFSPFFARADTVPAPCVDKVTWKCLIVCDKDCHAADLAKLASNIIYDLTILALPFAAIAFAWAGFLILTSAGSEEKMKKGKSVLFKVAIGFAWIIGAYILVSFIVKTFVDTGGVNIIQ